MSEISVEMLVKTLSEVGGAGAFTFVFLDEQSGVSRGYVHTVRAGIMVKSSNIRDNGLFYNSRLSKRRIEVINKSSKKSATSFQSKNSHTFCVNFEVKKHCDLFHAVQIYIHILPIMRTVFYKLDYNYKLCEKSFCLECFMAQI